MFRRFHLTGFLATFMCVFACSGEVLNTIVVHVADDTITILFAETVGSVPCADNIPASRIEYRAGNVMSVGSRTPTPVVTNSQRRTRKTGKKERKNEQEKFL